MGVVYFVCYKYKIATLKKCVVCVKKYVFSIFLWDKGIKLRQKNTPTRPKHKKRLAINYMACSQREKEWERKDK